jgi:Transglutaminase-like superfamily
MTTPFTEIADRPCAEADELLLSLAAEFWPLDTAAAQARLDDDARRLFDAPALAPADCAHRLGTVLEHELRITPDAGSDPELLRLDRLVHRPRGHPLVIAVLGVELLRRAGVQAAVCSSPKRPSARRRPAGSSASPAATGPCCSTRGSPPTTICAPIMSAATARTSSRSAC